jgi:adenine deaminase
VTASDRARLMRVALGEAPADLLVSGGTVLNVYTEEWLAWDVAVAGERIAAAGPDLGHLAGPATERIDARGRFVVPGFIDGHTHADSLVTVPELLREAIPRGLTTLITEMGQPAAALGAGGARWLLDVLAAQPIHAYATAPVIAYLTTDDGSGRPVIDEAEMAALLEAPGILGLGEIYWHRLLPEPDRLLGLIARARALGKSVEGHSAGARGARLQAFAAAGVGSCHEPITAREAVDLLRLGLTVLIREGSVRRDLDAVAAIRHEGVALRRVALATDGVWPVDLLARGHLDGAVRRAIDLGIPPATAYQMVSLNVAEHFGLDRDLGGIAPGRSADFLLLPDRRAPAPEVVVARGRVVARDGRCVAALAPAALPAALYGGLRVGPIAPAAFRIPAPGPTARVRVIRSEGRVLTREDEAELAVRDGAVAPAPERDCLLAAALDRRGTGRRATAVVRGFGLREGALASSVSFDTADVVAVGASAGALAAAVERVVALRGGLVAVDGAGRVRAEVAFPVGGFASPDPLPAVARALTAFGDAARALGCPFADPLLPLETLTFQAIPALRLTTRGLLDVKRRELVPVLRA